MVHTEKTRFLAKLIIYLISAHTAIYVLNNYAHGKIDMFCMGRIHANHFNLLSCTSCGNSLFIYALGASGVSCVTWRIGGRIDL